ncbi:MAG: hypothetical protein HY922_09530 [Elusimicrobia bacterium]|nr:hypothetical protein [Elusimicrobiota bacterium]
MLPSSSQPELLLPQIRLRKPFWKRGGFWCLFVFVLAMPFIYRSRVSLERKFRATFLPKLASRAKSLKEKAAQTFGEQAKEAYKVAKEIGRDALPNQPPSDDNLPTNPPASTLEAPDASPRLASDGDDVTPEALVKGRRDPKDRQRLALGHSPMAGAGYQYKEHGVQVAKRKKYGPVSKTSIAPGQEIQGGLYSFESSQEEEVSFFETDLGKGILLALGFSGVFGLMGYALLSINKDYAKKT